MFYEKIEQRPELSLDARRDVWNLMANFPISSRTIQVIPKDHAAVYAVRTDGIRGAYQPNATRSLRDLEENGLCIDGLRPGPSTLPQAGRGAFAQRRFAKGSIVTGTPLLFTHSEDYFRIYDGDWYEKRATPQIENFFGYQLALNYCWRHWSSVLYFCPYGYEVNHINHNQTQANVRMEWARDGFLGHQAHWLTKHPLAMKDKYTPGLFMNIVATRDIDPGEEIFLDYGDDWEDAWHEHVTEFYANRRHSPDYVSARDWNKANAKAVLRTSQEQAADPYPNHMEVRCLNEVYEFPNMTSATAESYWTFDNVGVECEIVDRQPANNNNNSDTLRGEMVYRIHFAYTYYDPATEQDAKVWLESNGWVVREAIRLVDRPYSSDLWLPGAFRFPIGIPDDIFPDAWRDFDYYDT